MKKDLFDILACPSCRGELRINIDEGSQDFVKKGNFLCLNCKTKYDIIDDIPYFSLNILHKGVKNQFETYSYWFEALHNKESIIDDECFSKFHNSIRLEPEEFKEKIVLDAGCGNGRFSYVVSHYDPKLLVSFDISRGLNKAREAILEDNPSAEIAFIQGDLTRPPFKKNSFDIAFSWGVTHHTPDTKKTFRTISDLIRIGGKLGIFVYPFNPVYDYRKQYLGLIAYLRSYLLIKPLRFICSRLPVSIVLLIFQPIYYFEKIIGFGIFGNHGPPPNKFEKDRYFRVVVDRFKTRYASEHTLEEILKWFTDNNYNELKIGYEPKVSITGKKQDKFQDLVDISLPLKKLKE